MAKVRRRGKQTVPNQTARVRDERQQTARETTAAGRFNLEDPQRQSRGRLNLDTGEFERQLPASDYQEGESRPRLPSARRRIGEWEAEVRDRGDGAAVAATRRFKRGGVVKKAPAKKRRR